MQCTPNQCHMLMWHCGSMTLSKQCSKCTLPLIAIESIALIR